VEFEDLFEHIHQIMDISPGLPVRIGLVFLPSTNPNFKMLRISCFNLIDLPILYFQDQETLLIPE
jgi:hypothetical protein